jgi:hypothetical protein
VVTALFARCWWPTTASRPWNAFDRWKSGRKYMCCFLVREQMFIHCYPYSWILFVVALRPWNVFDPWSWHVYVTMYTWHVHVTMYTWHVHVTMYTWHVYVKTRHHRDMYSIHEKSGRKFRSFLVICHSTHTRTQTRVLYFACDMYTWLCIRDMHTNTSFVLCMRMRLLLPILYFHVAVASAKRRLANMHHACTMCERTHFIKFPNGALVSFVFRSWWLLCMWVGPSVFRVSVLMVVVHVSRTCIMHTQCANAHT